MKCESIRNFYDTRREFKASVLYKMSDETSSKKP